MPSTARGRAGHERYAALTHTCVGEGGNGCRPPETAYRAVVTPGVENCHHGLLTPTVESVGQGKLIKLGDGKYDSDSRLVPTG